ncbi:hypothetical protein B0H11DRAFT_1935371 [Mycena galericulata]|nr:hypothetical protein B0H11DRAFT_1935371 [Mycena galericulata]
MVDGALLAYSRKRKPSDKPKAPDPPPVLSQQVSFLDTMAEESDDAGKTLSDDDEESDLTEPSADEMKGFIASDRDDTAPSDDTRTLLSPVVQDDDAPVLISTHSSSPRKRRKTHTKVLDSDEEDPSALQTGDSMFSSSSGVKASAKQRQREDAADSSLEIVESPTKDGKRKSGKRAEDTPDRPSGSLNKDQEKETLTIAGSDRPLSGAGGNPTTPMDFEKMMAAYMAAQGPLLAQHVMANLMPTVKTAIRDSVAALVPSSSASKLGPLEPSPMLIEDKQQGTSNVKQASDEQTKPIMPVVPPYSSLNTVEEFLDPPSAEMLDIASTAVADPASTEVLDLSDMFISKGGLSPEKSSAHSDGELDKPSQGEPVKTDGTTAIDLLKDAIPIGPDVTCLDDLESYKNRFDPNVTCGVTDLSLQDPRLKRTYVGLPPLPGGRYIWPSYTPPNSNDNLDHVWFSRWDLANINQVYDFTMESAMTMTRDGSFINPARISPALIVTRPTTTGSVSMRINIENKTAICVSPGMCMESWVTNPYTGGGDNGRKRKLISLMFHSQEWERWEAFMCLCFGEDHMFTAMTRYAVQMGTMLSKPDNKHSRDEDTGNRTIPSMLSPTTSTPTKRQRPSGPPSSPAWQNDPNRVSGGERFQSIIHRGRVHCGVVQRKCSRDDEAAARWLQSSVGCASLRAPSTGYDKSASVNNDARTH